MRSEKEKKSITKSIKLSPLQVQQIEEKAKEKNLTFSSYMVDCAVHGNNSITPQMAVRIAFVNKKLSHLANKKVSQL